MKRNINYFILELQKAFRLKPLLISVIGIYITMFLTIWRELPYYQEFDVLYCFQYARTEGFYLIFLLFAAIPYTRAFVHDFQNKSYRLLLVRARSTLTYSISKVCFALWQTLREQLIAIWPIVYYSGQLLKMVAIQSFSCILLF